MARRFIGAALLALAATTFGAACSPSLLVLLVALALYGPASGCAVATAEGALVEAAPEQRERTLARITLAGVVGDLAVPALLAVISWRETFRLSAALALGLAVVIGASRGLDRPIAGDDEQMPEPPPRWREVLRDNPAVIAWSLADLATNLMDEVLAAFIVVYVSERVDDSPASLSLVLGALVIGGLVGLASLDRLLGRMAPMRILAAAGALGVLALTALVMTRELAVALPLAFMVGVLVSTFHPIVKARAYAALPGRPGIVNAVSAALGPLELGAALLVGELAGAFGAHVALNALGLVPALMVLVAWRAHARSK